MAGKVKRTPRRKFNDIKTLCKYIETQAANKGLETANLTIEEADDIFLKIATGENCLKLPDGKRSVRWATTLKKVRESRKLAQQARETNEANPTEPSVNQDEEIEENEEARRNPATTRNTEMTTTPTVVTAETRQIRRNVYWRRNQPAAASREEEKSKRTSHRNGNSRTISTRDCNQKTPRTRSNDRHNNSARKRRRTRNATIYNTPNDDDSEAFAAAFASIEGPTSVDAVNRQRDREEGKDGEEGLNAVMRREAAQVRAARGEPQEEQPVALTDGTALHLNLSANGFPIGPCGIRGGCDHPHQELRPIHRCVHCQTIVHLLCAGEPTDQEQVTCGCRDDYK